MPEKQTDTRDLASEYISLLEIFDGLKITLDDLNVKDQIRGYRLVEDKMNGNAVIAIVKHAESPVHISVALARNKMEQARPCIHIYSVLVGYDEINSSRFKAIREFSQELAGARSTLRLSGVRHTFDEDTNTTEISYGLYLR